MITHACKPSTGNEGKGVQSQPGLHSKLKISWNQRALVSETNKQKTESTAQVSVHSTEIKSCTV